MSSLKSLALFLVLYKLVYSFLIRPEDWFAAFHGTYVFFKTFKQTLHPLNHAQATAPLAPPPFGQPISE